MYKEHEVGTLFNVSPTDPSNNSNFDRKYNIPNVVIYIKNYLSGRGQSKLYTHPPSTSVSLLQLLILT